MLASYVVQVEAAETGLLPAFTGRAMQAWLLRQVAARDAAHAEALHDGSGPRPYTVSSLLGLGRAQSGRISVAAGAQGWLRLTSLSSDLTSLLDEQIAPALPDSLIDIDGMRLRVLGISSEASAHPWAGRALPAALIQAGALDASAERAVTLRFASATSFKSAGASVPFPLPGLVFGSLLDRWNEFCALGLHPDARRFATEMVAASRFSLRTRYVSFEASDRGAISGCVGFCRYVPLSRDRFWTGTLRTLALFAFFSGVGVRTAMGLGQLAAWDESARKPLQVG